MNGRTGWTMADDEILIAMRKNGATRPEIAHALGRSLASVQGRIKRLNLGDAQIKRPGPPKKECTSRCGTCRYGSTAGGVKICDYIGITGHTRGCPPGNGCKRYIRGRKARSRYRPLEETA